MNWTWTGPSIPVAGPGTLSTVKVEDIVARMESMWRAAKSEGWQPEFVVFPGKAIPLRCVRKWRGKRFVIRSMTTVADAWAAALKRQRL